MEMINNLIVISDLHGGCKLALCPPNGITLDDGGSYMPSKLQLVLWAWWREFWDEWVPEVCRGEPFALVVNGDALDGTHHNSVTQISHNLSDQSNLAYEILAPIVESAKGGYYHIRGTEAHSGKSGQEEERLAQKLKAIPNKSNQYARWELWIRIGYALTHCSHHIGTTGSMAYETSAIQKELEQIYVESARWENEPPDVVVRSHRHRNAETRVRRKKDGKNNFAISFVTPGWQLKTPFAYRIAGGRVTQPQIGGSLVRCGDEEIYSRHQVWDIEREEVETPCRQ